MEEEFRDRTEINLLTQDDDPRIGLVVVISITTSEGPTNTGPDQDVKVIKKTFGELLNYAVWEVQNPHKEKIQQALQHAIINLPHKYKHIIVYYSGHGCSDQDGKAYIETQKKDDNSETKLYIETDIISMFKKERARLQNKYCMFFFDCCLDLPGTGGTINQVSTINQGLGDCLIAAQPSVTTSNSSHGTCMSVFLPPDGFYLVAYSTTLRNKAYGNYIQGGSWTSKLCENITNYDLPISTILEITWWDLVKEGSNTGCIQAPHFISNIGPVFLRGNKRKNNQGVEYDHAEEFIKYFKHTPQQPPVQQPFISLQQPPVQHPFVSFQQPPVQQPFVSLQQPPLQQPFVSFQQLPVHQSFVSAQQPLVPPQQPPVQQQFVPEYTSDDIMDKTPQINHLIEAIKLLEKDNQVLNHFADNLLGEKGLDICRKYFSLKNWLEEIYRSPEKYFPDDEIKHVTWRKVHDSLYLNRNLNSQALILPHYDNEQVIKGFLEYLNDPSILQTYIE